MRFLNSSASPGLRPQVGDHLLKFALFFQIAEDHVDLADDQLEHAQLGLEQVQDCRLYRVSGDEVEDMHVVRLADAAEPADALLDLHRVPGQVEIANGVGKLQVAAFTACFRGQQQPGRAAKALHRCLFFQTGEASVKDGQFVAGLGEPLCQHLLRGAELGENHHLVGEFAEQSQQAIHLGAFRLELGPLGKLDQLVRVGTGQVRIFGNAA